MKNQALEILMGTYQQAGNSKKTMDTAAKLVARIRATCGPWRCFRTSTESWCKVRRPTIRTFRHLLADGKKYGQQGLDCLPKFDKPDGTSDADFQKTKDQMNAIFHAALGIAELQQKDNANAAKDLRITVDANPTDFSVVYPLALAYLGQTPPDSQNGIWYRGTRRGCGTCVRRRRGLKSMRTRST